MSSPKFQSNPIYVTLVDLLHQLHFLMRDGKDDEEGDRVRDAMDPLWYKLSAEEQDRIGAMSADLKTLEPDSPIKHPATAVLRPDDFRERLSELYDGRDWECVLTLLRDRPECISIDQATYLRGRCWEELGDAATARLFYEFGSRLGDNFEAAYLLFLYRQNQLAEARQQVLQITARKAPTSVALRQVMGQILFASSRVDSDENRLRDIDVAARILESTMAVADGTETSPSIVLVLLGLCYQQLGRLSEARAVYDRIIAAEPANIGALVARGVLMYSIEMDVAVSDFQNAIHFGTNLVWPYAFLAHYELVRGEFVAALALSQSALLRTNSAAHRAQLLEWMGIAATALGRPWDEIRSYFQTAILFAPYNRRIYENFQRFENAVENSIDTRHTKWELPERASGEWKDSWLRNASMQFSPELTAA